MTPEPKITEERDPAALLAGFAALPASDQTRLIMRGVIQGTVVDARMLFRPFDMEMWPG